MCLNPALMLGSITDSINDAQLLQQMVQQCGLSVCMTVTLGPKVTMYQTHAGKEDLGLEPQSQFV